MGRCFPLGGTCVSAAPTAATNLVENIGSHPRRPVSPVSALNAALSRPSKSRKARAFVATSANGSTCSRLKEDDAQRREPELKFREPPQQAFYHRA